MTDISRVFVAGAGLMGHGIAQVHAAIGKHVVLYEPELERAEAGRERIAGNLQRAVDKGGSRPTIGTPRWRGSNRPTTWPLRPTPIWSSRRSSRTWA